MGWDERSQDVARVNADERSLSRVRSRCPVLRVRCVRRAAAGRHDRRQLRPHRHGVSRPGGAGGGADRTPMDLRPAARRRRQPRAGAGGGRGREGRPGGDLGAQRGGVDADPVRHREDRRDPRQHQPGLPHARAGVRAQPGRHLRAGVGDRVQDLRLRGHDRRGAPAVRCAARGGVHRQPRVGPAAAGGRRARSRRARGAAERALARRRDQHPVHLGHHRLPEGRHALATTTSSTTGTSSAVAAATPRRTGSASRCPSTTASAW